MFTVSMWGNMIDSRMMAHSLSDNGNSCYQMSKCKKSKSSSASVEKGKSRRMRIGRNIRKMTAGK